MKKDIFTIINTRRSIREFTDDPVHKEDLLIIAKAAQASPTSVNSQSRKHTIVHKKDLIKDLAHAIGIANGQSTYDLYDPQAILLISSPRDYTYGEIETGLAVMNAYLATTALGLGTVWTNQIRGNCDHPEVRQVLDKIGIPSHHICYCVLPIGVPKENPPVKRRNEDILYVD